jgi:hypothetical protein
MNLFIDTNIYLDFYLLSPPTTKKSSIRFFANCPKPKISTKKLGKKYGKVRTRSCLFPVILLSVTLFDRPFGPPRPSQFWTGVYSHFGWLKSSFLTPRSTPPIKFKQLDCSQRCFCALFPSSPGGFDNAYRPGRRPG